MEEKDFRHTGTESEYVLTSRQGIIIAGMGMIGTDKNLYHLSPLSARSLSQRRTENIEIGRRHIFL